MSGLALFIAVFLACAVEAVEATTIVLAAGTARDWKSALLGTGAGLGTLVAIIALLGPSLSRLPINDLRLFVGALLLIFGLQWVRKAILRSSGFKALHDEDKIFQEELAIARKARADQRFGVADWYAFTLSFKGVLLEGLEVAFIVLTFGTIQHQVGLASLAALCAVAVTALVGFALRKPLARVPENTMKYIVGIMLTSFGIFWGAEGAGAQWPHKDLSLPLIIVFMVAVSQTLIALLKKERQRQVLHDAHSKIKNASLLVIEMDDLNAEATPNERGVLKVLRNFGAFWYDFLIGDDLIGFAIVLTSLELTHIVSNTYSTSWLILPLGVCILLPINLFRVTR
jgi:uncharacterized membrane protein